MKDLILLVADKSMEWTLQGGAGSDLPRLPHAPLRGDLSEDRNEHQPRPL